MLKTLILGILVAIAAAGCTSLQYGTVKAGELDPSIARTEGRIVPGLDRQDVVRIVGADATVLRTSIVDGNGDLSETWVLKYGSWKGKIYFVNGVVRWTTAKKRP